MDPMIAANTNIKKKLFLQNRAADFCGIKLWQVIMYINTLYLHLLHSIVSPPPHPTKLCV